MSIRAEITARRLDRRLRRFEPHFPGGVDLREINLTKEVGDALGGIGIESHEASLFGRAQARFEQFVAGEEMVCRLPPSRTPHVLLALLHSWEDEVWEFKVDRLRIFGRFAEKDVFIATNWAPRQRLGSDAGRWRFACETCKSTWRHLFPTYEPHTGTHLDDYISNARAPL